MLTAADYRPPWWLRNGHLQTMLGSNPWRRRQGAQALAATGASSSEHLVDGGDGVRLHGLYSAVPGIEPRGLALLLHGWEGSADSLYLLSLAQLLYARGVAVIRLNLRDHGGTHALNRELFHSCRLSEVVGAVARVQALFPAHRLLLAGYSLGGNFCLRVGARAPSAGIRIARIVAVCPVLNPATTLEALERGPSVYRNYFLFKWRRSLQLKQAAWPGDYDFGDMIRDPSLTAMTERMVLKYTDFPDLATYLGGYAITGNVLETLEAPAHLLTSKDDPMILTHDLEGVARPRSLEITVTSRGGHCGYMDAMSGPSWVDRRIADELATA